MASRSVPVMRMAQACCRSARALPQSTMAAGSDGAKFKKAARQIKQITVSRRKVCRQGVTQRLYEKVANPITVSPDRYPTGLASSAAGSFPRVGRTWFAAPKAPRFHFGCLNKSPDSPTTARSLLGDRGFCKEPNKSCGYIGGAPMRDMCRSDGLGICLTL